MSGSVRSPAGPSLPNFWSDIAARAKEKLIEAVDFVGHNFYVDVFEEPVQPEDIPAHVESLLVT